LDSIETGSTDAAGIGKPEKERLSFYPLPMYEQDRRYDTYARGEEIASLPFTDDYEDKFKKIAEPGWYAVVLRVGGRIAKTFVLELPPDERTVKTDAPIPTPETKGGEFSAQYLALLVQHVLSEQEKKFSKILEAQKEELKKTTATNGDAPQGSIADQMKGLLGVMEQMKKLNGSDEPKRSDSTDDQFDKFLSMYDRMAEIQERVNPGGDDGTAGTVNRSMQMLERIVNKAPALISAARGRWGGGTSSNGSGGGLNITDEALKPFEPVLSIIVEDMTADAGVERAGAAVEGLLKNDAKLQTQAELLFSMSVLELLDFIAGATGAHYLTRLPHSVGWLNNFYDDLKERVGEEGE
jgi:hypothetical protein